MGSRHTCGWIFVLTALQLTQPGSLLAMSKLILIPTARTIGARQYRVELDRKAPLLDAPARSVDLTPKVGVGARLQFDAQIPLQSANGGSGVLFFGKYTFAVSRGSLTAAAVGVENVGSESRATPYLAVSHLLKPVDITIGLADGTGSTIRYFAGADYLIGRKLHVLMDYNTGSDTFASAGFDYEMSHRWGLKSGWEANRNGSDDVMVELVFSGVY